METAIVSRRPSAYPAQPKRRCPVEKPRPQPQLILHLPGPNAAFPYNQTQDGTRYFPLGLAIHPCNVQRLRHLAEAGFVLQWIFGFAPERANTQPPDQLFCTTASLVLESTAFPAVEWRPVPNHQ